MRKVLTYIFIAGLFASCSEKINFDLNSDENKRLVADAFLTDEGVKQQIQLSRTTSYYYNQPAPPEENATVSITDGIRTINFTEVSPGIYETPQADSGMVGNTYTLNITTSDNQNYTATSDLKRVADIDSISYDYSTYWEEYVLYFYGKEPAGKGDYYMWQVYIDGQLDNDTLNEVVFSEDDYVDGATIPGLEFYYIPPGKLKDTSLVTVKMLSISKDYYDYILASLLETEWRGGPFDGPPANIPTNINNGAVGFFNTSAVSSYTFKLIK